MFALNSNESIKVAQLQKLANQAMLNHALATELAFSESTKNFDGLKKRGTL